MELLLFVKAREFHRLGAETLVDLGLRVKMLKTAHGEPLTAFRARETGAGGLASPPRWLKQQPISPAIKWRRWDPFRSFSRRSLEARLPPIVLKNP